MTRSYNTENSPSRASLLLNTSNDQLLEQEPASNMQTCIPQVQTNKQTYRMKIRFLIVLFRVGKGRCAPLVERLVSAFSSSCLNLLQVKYSTI